MTPIRIHDSDDISERDRRVVDALCHVCEMPIGFETPFYDDGKYGPIHVTCYGERGVRK